MTHIKAFAGLALALWLGFPGLAAQAGPACDRVAKRPQAAPQTPATAAEDFECHLERLGVGTGSARELMQAEQPMPEIVLTLTGYQFGWRVAYSLTEDGSPKRYCPSAAAVYLPQGRTVELQVTADDVIHELSVPGLALQVDAIPGCINVSALDTRNLGTFRGQASKMSGDGYAAMTVSIRIVDDKTYQSWRDTVLRQQDCHANDTR